MNAVKSGLLCTVKLPTIIIFTAYIEHGCKWLRKVGEKLLQVENLYLDILFSNITIEMFFCKGAIF